MDIVGRIFALLSDPEVCDQAGIQFVVKKEQAYMTALNKHVEMIMQNQDSSPNSEVPKMSKTFLTTAAYLYSPDPSQTPPFVAVARSLVEQFMQIETDLANTPTTQRFVECGVQLYLHAQKEGETLIPLFVFSAAFRSCALLWQYFNEELNTKRDVVCQQLLIHRLYDCKNLCKQVFNRAPECMKETMVLENKGSITFALQLSSKVLQGNLPDEPRQIASDMIIFIKQSQHYLPLNIEMGYPRNYKELMEKLEISAHPTEVTIAALELIVAALLNSTDQYGWMTTIHESTFAEIFLSQLLSCNMQQGDVDPFDIPGLSWKSEMLYLTTKAIYAYKPGIPGIEALLSTDALSLIVKLLRKTIDSRQSSYSKREILMVVKAVTRVSANCTGLIDEGLENVLCILSESTDNQTKTFIESISRQINAVLRGEDLSDSIEQEIKDKPVDVLWESSSNPDDSNGTTAMVDSILQKLDKLIEDAHPGKQSVSEVVITEAFMNAVSFCWYSEPKMQIAVTHLIGDKYIKCLIQLHYVMHEKLIQRNVDHGVFVRDLARTSEYFCEKAIINGFVEDILSKMCIYNQRLLYSETHAQLENELALIFYCAQLTKFHYDPFGKNSAIDTIAVATKVSVGRIRLIARLIICSLFQVTEERHMKLLQVTKQELDILCSYIAYPRPPGCLDSAKLFKAASILLRESKSHDICISSCLKIAKRAQSLLFQNPDNDIIDGALHMLLTLCHTPAIALHMCQEQNFIQLLTWLQQSPCLALSFPSRSLLWQLGYGMYQDPTECLYHAYTYLQCGFYTECIDWCNQATQLLKNIQTAFKSPMSVIQPTHLASIATVRGIAHAHIMQHMIWQSTSETKHDESVTWKGGDLVDQSTISARDAVIELGFVLDQGMLDDECSYFMDMAMMYYGNIKKQVEDCKRCLLCRRKGVKLKNSHIIPNFMLKRVGKTMASTCGRFTERTSKTSWRVKLLCGRCEECLSQNGEHQFQEQFIPIIYSGSNEDQIVNYDNNLYNFAVGIIFRSFLDNVNLYTYPNTREMYSMIMSARNHLLSLPTSYDKEKNIRDPPPVIGITPPPPVEAYLILNPSALHLQNLSLEPLIGMMSRSASVAYIPEPFSGGPATKYIHFILVRMCVCNVIAPLLLEPKGTIDEVFHINPHGGEYNIPSDNNRWKSTPRTIFSIIAGQTELSRIQAEKITSGLSVLQKDSKSADAYSQVHSLYALAASMEEIDATALQALPKEEAELVSWFVSQKSNPENRVALLPQGYDLKRESDLIKHSLDLPEGDVLLYHIAVNKIKGKSVILYFVGNPEHISASQVDVLIDDQQKIEGVCMQINESSGSSFVCITGYLSEPKTETRRLEIKHIELFAASEKIQKAMNTLMKRCGQPTAFLRHATMQIRQHDKVSLDHRCSEAYDLSYICPFCMYRCHVCMKPANVGYTLRPHRESTELHHCSSECKAMVDEHQIHLRHHSILHKGNKQLSLALISIHSCLETFMSAYTVVQVYIDLLIPQQSSILTCGRPYATIQLKTHKQHLCFSVYLADDFTPVEPMYTFPADFGFQQFKESNILQQLLDKAFEGTNICSVSQLIAKSIELNSSLTTLICLTLTSHNRNSYVDILSSMNRHLNEELLCSDWMLMEMTACDYSLRLLPMSTASCSLSHLFTSTSVIPHIFWAYFQLVSLLWKQVLMDEGKGLKNLYVVQKLKQFVGDIKLVYEQAAVDLQDHISDQVYSRSEVILLCGRLAMTILQDGICLNLEEPSINFLLLAHKFIVINDRTDVLSSTMDSLYQNFEKISKTDIQSDTKISGVAQHFIATLLLLSLSDTNAESKEKLQSLLAFAEKIMESPFIMVAFMARAITAHLESSLHTSRSAIINCVDEEIDYLAMMINKHSHNHCRRRYYLKAVVKALMLLCSNKVCLSYLAKHEIVNELQTLLECAKELEDVTANLIYKIITGEGEIKTTLVTTESGKWTHEASLNLSLQMDEGLHYVFDKLMMIITEFNILYLCCKKIPQCQAHAYSAVAVLLNVLHQVLEKSEREALTKFLLNNITTLEILGQAISKKRWMLNFVPNGSNVRKSIEELLIIWTDSSKAICQALVGVGILKDIADSLKWAITCEVLTDVDTESLQNQLCIVFKCALQIPLQIAHQLKDSDLQVLLNCSFVSVRTQSKFLLAILSKHLKVENVRDLSLLKDEIAYIIHCLNNHMQYNSTRKIPNDRSVFSSIDELIHSLQCLLSLPVDKTYLAQSPLIDTMVTLSSHKDMPYAKKTFEVIWDLFMDNKIAPLVARNKSISENRQQLFPSSRITFDALATLSSGKGNIEGAADIAYTFAGDMYKSNKYWYATALCYQIINAVDSTNPIFWKAKCCTAKCIAHIYFGDRIQHILKGSSWNLPGWDINSTGENGEKHWWPERLEYGSAILRKLSIESWMALRSQGLHAIKELGEALDAKKLDKEGTQLLDWMMMDYSILTGALSECKRCLLCRKLGELVRMKHPGCRTIICLQSLTHTSNLQSYYLFCRKCFNTITTHQQVSVKFLQEAKTCYKTVAYDKNVYLSLVSHIIFSLPTVYSCIISNQQDIYEAYLACRNVILFPDKCKDTTTLPSIYLIRYPENWYIFNDNSTKLCEMKGKCYTNAIIASQNEISNGGDPHKCKYFLTYMGNMILMIDFGKKKDLPLQCLMNPKGSSYPLLTRQKIWETFHVSARQIFQTVTLAEDYIGTMSFHSVLTDSTKTLGLIDHSHFPASARILFPAERFYSFLPEQFQVKVVSNDIQSISFPEDHTVIGHSYDADNDVTLILISNSDSEFHEDEMYFILTCKLWGYCFAESGELKTFLSIPKKFPLSSSVSGQNFYQVRYQLKKVCRLPFLRCLMRIFAKYGVFRLQDLSLYGNITRNVELTVSVDSVCSTECCWYCKNRCHCCLKPGAIGYTNVSNGGVMQKYCSEMCYHIFTAKVANSIVLDVTVGKVPSHPFQSSYLLLSSTVLLESSIARNTIVSAHLFVSYNCQSIPSGVACVHLQVCTPDGRSSSLPVIIQHNLTPVKMIHKYDKTTMQRLKKGAYIERTILPALKKLNYKDLQQFLQAEFQSLNIKFLDTQGQGSTLR